MVIDSGVPTVRMTVSPGLPSMISATTLNCMSHRTDLSAFVALLATAIDILFSISTNRKVFIDVVCR